MAGIRNRIIAEEPRERSTLGAGLPHRAFGLSMGLEDWARHTQIPAGDLRHRIDQYGMPLEAVLTSLGWTPRPEEPEPGLLRITAAQLQPGDHILGVEHCGTGQQFLTVRRSHASPAPPDTAPGRSPRSPHTSVHKTPPSPQPTAPRTPSVRR